MRRWIEFVAAFYPRSWREEFGPEFGALLDDVKPGWRVFANVLRGALEMQVTEGTNWIRLMGAMAAAGAIVAVGLSFTVAPRYVSSATVSVTAQADPVRATSSEVQGQRVAARVATMEAAILSRTELCVLINDPRLQLYKTELRNEPLEDVIAQMRHDIRIEARPSWGGGPIVFSISFAYRDQAKAQAAVDALAAKFVEMNARFSRSDNDAYLSFWNDISAFDGRKGAPPPPAGEIVGVVNSASRPEAEGPDRFGFLAWGLGVGLLLSLLAPLTMRQPHGIRRLVGFAVGGCVLAGAASFLIPNRYTSTAVMTITPAQITEDPLAPLPPGTPAAEFLRQMAPEVLSFQSLSRLIQDPRLNVYPEERAKKTIEEVVRDMVANDLRVVPMNPASGAKAQVSAFTISFSYPDRFKAQQIVFALMNTFDERYALKNRKMVETSQSMLLRQIIQRKEGEVLDVLDTPDLPSSLSNKPSRLTIAMAGLVLGLGLGAATIFRRRPRTADMIAS